MTDWQEPLLTTKYLVPYPPCALIPRHQLMKLLDEGMSRPLTLVSAPAGFGKTTLLSAWARSQQNNSAQVAWLSLTEEDNDLTRFWTYTLAALDKAQPGLCADLVALSQKYPSIDLSLLLTALINRLAQNSRSILLILDDYHVITEQAIHASLFSLLEHLPPQVHVMLSTRADPPMRLARLRAHNQMLEVRAEQLGCSEAETAEFFRAVIGLDLSHAEVQEVTTRTEGWFAGLQIIGSLLRGRRCRASVLEEVSGSHRHLIDFLTEEVLRRQSPALQAFLLHTSILSKLTGPLCDAVTEQANSQGMLEELARTNVFLFPQDRLQYSFRYHILFAQALRALLERADPSLIPTLHRRASVWYAEHGYLNEAIQHALSAQDWEHAVDLIERCCAQEQDEAMMYSWLDQLPASMLHASQVLHDLYEKTALSVPPPPAIEMQTEIVSEQAFIKQVEKPEENERAPEAHGKATNAENIRSHEPKQPLLDPLSARELEVLSLLARGDSNQKIAETLVIAIETVKRHVSSILSKLGVCNRTQAMARAHDLGLLRDDPQREAR